MSEKLKQQILVITTNILKLIGFIILAIHFQKWWLVLISILFMTSIEYEKDNKND